jgi:hypothetical protein
MMYPFRKPVKQVKFSKKKDGKPSPLEIQRMMNDYAAVENGELFSKYELKSTDLLDGRGGDKTHDKAHQAFLDLKDEHHQEYKDCTNNKEKHRCRDTVIDLLQLNGTRFFIRIGGMDGMYRLMTIAEIRRKISQALREPRKAKQAKRKVSQISKYPSVVDPENDDHLHIAHALDSVESEAVVHNHGGCCEGTYEAMEFEYVDDHNHFNYTCDDRVCLNQVFTDFYQDGNEAGVKVEGSHCGNVDWTHGLEDLSVANAKVKSGRTQNPKVMKQTTFTNFFDDVETVGNLQLHAELPYYHAAAPAVDHTMAHSQLKVECDIYEPIDWKIGVMHDAHSINELDWSYALTVFNETSEEDFRNIMSRNF